MWAAEQKGVEVITVDGNNDPNTGVIIEDVINKGVMISYSYVHRK